MSTIPPAPDPATLNTQLQAALQQHQRGDLEGAVTQVRTLLQSAPDSAQAQQLLGALLCRQRAFEPAIEVLEPAVRALPDHRDAHLNLIKAYRALQRHAQALAAVDAWLAEHDADPEAWLLRGRTLLALKKTPQALEAFARAHALDPDALDAQAEWAGALQDRDPVRATEIWQAVLERDPKHVMALAGLAQVALAQDEPERARDWLRRALECAPNRHALLNNMGNALLKTGEWDLARSHYERALVAKPGDPATLVNLGNVLRILGHSQQAQATLRQVLHDHPDNAAALNNLGILATQQGRPAEALACFEEALRHTPDSSDLWANLGAVHLELGERDACRRAVERAVALDPHSSVARFGLANLDLLEGHWLQGWENYEHRWRGAEHAGRRFKEAPRMPWPLWHGQDDTAAHSILVFHEQGLGDTLQFLRYLNVLVDRFARVVFFCQLPILRLARASLHPSIEVLSAPNGVLAASWAPFDWQCPLLSLPRALRLQPALALAPGANGWGYLQAPIAQAQALHVGLCWCGNPSFTVDAKRSVPLHYLDALLDIPGVAWHGLVLDAQEHDPRVPCALDGVRDFADTAQRLHALDLVISVDTALAHLAAGLGKPVWLLNRFSPDWRWGWQGEGCVWYPSLRQFRQQQPGDWSGVLEAVEAALGQWVRLRQLPDLAQ